MYYKVETKVVKASFFKNAQDNIQKEIQPMLDKGAKQGWRLHTFTTTNTSEGINFCVVWAID